MAGNGSYQGTAQGAGGQQKIKEGRPDVSVVIPVHNGAGTLSAALDSALGQEVSLEILVVDDASSDNLEQVMKRYQGLPQVRFLRNEKNLGAASSRNKAVKEARGDYVAFLDSDDFWAEGKLEKQLKLLEQGDFSLCCTARELMSSKGELTGKVIPVKKVISYGDLLHHNSINCSSVLLPRETALEFPMEHEDSHEDYITWLKILKKYGPGAGINEPLLKYRLSAKGKSGSKLKSARMTFRVYRYMGFGWLQSLACFASYALCGVTKYLRAALGRKRTGETEPVFQRERPEATPGKDVETGEE